MTFDFPNNIQSNSTFPRRYVAEDRFFVRVSDDPSEDSSDEEGGEENNEDAVDYGGVGVPSSPAGGGVLTLRRKKKTGFWS